MDLLDAMCRFPERRSVVEYSLAACFPRSYSTIFKAIDEMDLARLWLPDELRSYLPRPKAVAVLAVDGGCDAGASSLCLIRWQTEGWSISRRW